MIPFQPSYVQNPTPLVLENLKEYNLAIGVFPNAQEQTSLKLLHILQLPAKSW